MIGIDPHRHGDAARRGDDPFIGGVIGIGHQHLIAHIDDRRHRGIECCLGAGQVDELILVNGAAGLARIEAGKGAPGIGLASAFGITRTASPHLLFGDIHDGAGRWRIGLADRQEDQRFAQRGAAFAVNVDSPFFRAEAIETFGDFGKAHGRPLDVGPRVTRFRR